jgi:hypothetical protein
MCSLPISFEFCEKVQRYACDVQIMGEFKCSDIAEFILQT